MVGAGVLTLLLAGDVTSRLDNALYDLNMQYWRYTPSGDVVIVAIDQKSIDALGSWPWPRANHGRLIDKLADFSVSNIGTNILIARPDTNQPENDRVLAQAIRRHGRVVMPLYDAPDAPGGPLQVRLPIPEVASAAASLGEIVVPIDNDGLSRAAFMYGGIRKPDWPLLPLAVYQLDHPLPEARRRGREQTPDTGGESPYVWTRYDYVYVRYAGPAGTFPSVSYVDVLNGNVDSGRLKGKTALVGMTAFGVGDRFATPGLRPETPMSAIEYMANVLESLRRDTLITPLGFSGSFLFGMVALAFPLLIFGWPGLRRTWVVGVIGVAMTLLASLLILRLAYVWWPPVSVVLIISAGSIVWSLLAPKLRREHSFASEDLTV